MLKDEEGSRDTRIMARLKDSLISQFTELDPSLSPSNSIHTHHSSYIQRRLPQLFHSFDTPTHPPYALMIRRAIMELNDGSGSTEEAISEFVRREYEDLPWAHVKILGLQLKKLCQVGELACTEGGRYVIPVDGGDETERCKGSRKRKRGKRRRSGNRGNGERRGTVEIVEIQSSNGLREEENDEQNLMLEWTQEKGEQACDHSIGRVEQQTESEKGRLEVVAKQSQHTEAEAPAPNEVQESQIQDSIPHLETICSPQTTAWNLPVDSQPWRLVPISEGLSKCMPAAGIRLTQTQLQPCHGPSESSLDAAAKMSASSSPLNVQEHKQDDNPMSGNPEQQHPNRQCREGPRNSKLVEDYQGESLFPSGDAIVSEQKPNVKKTKKSWQSQPQGRGVGREMHSKLRRNADQIAAPLTCVDVHDDKQPQHCNEGIPKGNLDENPTSGGLEQKLPKRPRGRPRKLVKGESLSDDGIHNRQRSNITNTKKQHGRGRGRPRKLNLDGEQSQQKDQAKRRGRGRGRGRPRKLNRNANQQLQPQGQAQGGELSKFRGDDTRAEPPAAEATNM